MSYYIDFITDFPKRCEEILSGYESLAELRGQEVTHMLAIAAAALLISYERMKNSTHPSGDRMRYEDASRQFDSLCETEFLGSELWGEGSASWRYGKI